MSLMVRLWTWVVAVYARTSMTRIFSPVGGAELVAGVEVGGVIPPRPLSL